MIALILLLVAASVAEACAAGDRAATAGAPEPGALTIGDAAPPLKVDRWLRGEPVREYTPGTVYVLDFWAVWCPPCVALLPHLSAIQDEFAARGVRVIALTGPDSAGTTLAAVETFVAQRRDQLRVTVAHDAPGGSAESGPGVLTGRTATAYVEGAGLDGIPISFVVDGKGRIAWIGQPPEVRAVVRAVVNGTWDVAAAAERYRAARAADPRLIELAALLMKGHGHDVMTEVRDLVEGPYATESGSLRVIADAMANAVRSGATGVDLDLALAAILRAEELSDHVDPTVLACLARVRFLRGQVEQAIAAQQRAIELSDPAQQRSLRESLDEYLRAAQPRQ